MLDLKVRKVGNSLGLVLPREVLSRLKLNEGDNLTSSHRIISLYFLNQKRLAEPRSLHDSRQTRMIRQNRYRAIAAEPFEEGGNALTLISTDLQ